MSTRALTLLIALTASSTAACQEQPGPPAATVRSEAAGQTAASGTPVTAAGLTFDLPAGWTQETPESQMRAAQAAIPGSGGAGQLTVFFFGPGGGGGVEANIQRWIGQMELEAGSEPIRGTSSAGVYQVTTVDAHGVLKASTIGSFPTTDQPGYRLFGAVVEGEGGPWFFRAVGPQATMAEQHEGFLALVRSVRAAG
jgi:hypothetical protein